MTPDGTRAISASRDQTCKVWDLATGQVVITFTGESPVWCCAVSPDGKTIVIWGIFRAGTFLRLEGID
ncbi:MAG: WD40 repeat domain-containing protein [Nitrospirales bacterium]